MHDVQFLELVLAGVVDDDDDDDDFVDVDDDFDDDLMMMMRQLVKEDVVPKVLQSPRSEFCFRH